LNRDKYDLASRFVAVVLRTERKNSRSASFLRSRSFGVARGGASLFVGLDEDEVYLRRGLGHAGDVAVEFLAVIGPCIKVSKLYHFRSYV
jgi:hypothetical protein